MTTSVNEKPDKITKICELHLATTTFVHKLTEKTIGLHSSSVDGSADDSSAEQNLLNFLQQWTDQLNSIGAQTVAASSANATPTFPIFVQPPVLTNPTVQPSSSSTPIQSVPPIPTTLSVLPPKGLSGMALLNVPKETAMLSNNGRTPTGTLPPNTMAFAMRNSIARLKPFPMMPRRPPNNASAITGAGTCGIGVVSGAVRSVNTNKAHLQQQRREQRLLSVRRIAPSNAYLSAGSKLYQQQQQQRVQTTPGVPPSFAYMSAGSKLSFRHQTLQQQQQLQRLIKRQQQKMPALPCPSSSSAADTEVAATVAAISSILSSDNSNTTTATAATSKGCSK